MCGEELPTRLLTPFQAERDTSTRDVYNYVTVMSDVQMPMRYIEGYLLDSERLKATEAALVQVCVGGFRCGETSW